MKTQLYLSQRGAAISPSRPVTPEAFESTSYAFLMIGGRRIMSREEYMTGRLSGDREGVAFIFAEATSEKGLTVTQVLSFPEANLEAAALMWPLPNSKDYILSPSDDEGQLLFDDNISKRFDRVSWEFTATDVVAPVSAPTIAYTYPESGAICGIVHATISPVTPVEQVLDFLSEAQQFGVVVPLLLPSRVVHERSSNVVQYISSDPADYRWADTGSKERRDASAASIVL